MASRLPPVHSGHADLDNYIHQSLGGRLVVDNISSGGDNNFQSKPVNIQIEINLMATIIQVGQRGTLTLPAELREKFNIRPGDAYYLADIDGVFVLTPYGATLVQDLAREIERIRLAAGISVDELLEGLREQRERYYREHYAGERSE